LATSTAVNISRGRGAVILEAVSGVSYMTDCWQLG
jgi:hypothetical protein